MRKLLVACVGLVVSSACGGPSSARPGELSSVPAHAETSGPRATPADAPVPGTLVRAGRLRAGNVRDGYVVVVPTGGDAGAVEAAMTTAARGAAVPAQVSPLDLRHFALGPDATASIARGLDRSALDALAQATHGVQVIVEAPVAQADAVRLGAAAIASVGVKRANGWIVDLSAVQIFSPASFEESRGPGARVDAVTWIQVMPRRDGGSITFATLGLARFGLPELELGGVPPSFAYDVPDLFTATAQTLIEGGTLARDGLVEVDTASLRTPPWPERHATIREGGGAGKATLTATWGERVAAADDAPATLVLGWNERDGGITATLSAFFDTPPMRTFYPERNPARAAARDQARRELAALAPHFAHGVPTGERLRVKAPLPTADRPAWLWVEVERWHGQWMLGTLVEDSEAAGLAKGETVGVKQAEVSDYQHRRADGLEVGGATDQLPTGSP